MPLAPLLAFAVGFIAGGLAMLVAVMRSYDAAGR